MLTLIVKTDDGARRKAVVKAGQEITIIRANPFLEKQGDYSLDIDLPLAGCAENIKIFGPAHRTEIAKLPYVGKRYPARLYAPPVSLKGSITVTKVTEAILTVQFIGGYSEMTESYKDMDGAEMYIDQLEGMGKAWEEHEIFTEFYDGTWAAEQDGLTETEGVMGINEYIIQKIESGSLKHGFVEDWHERIFAGQPDQTNYVAFPVVSHTGYSRNEWWPGNCGFVHNEETDEWTPFYKYASLIFLNSRCGFADDYLAPQPYLFFTLGRVLKAIGYNLVYNELEGTWLNSIFIANRMPVLDLKDMLPHMKISDFISEIERYFHVYIFIDGRDVYLYHNKLEDTAARERISEVVAEYEDSFEDANTDSVLSANLWYNYKEKPTKTLSLEEDDYKHLIIRANGREYNGILNDNNHHRLLDIHEDGRAYAYLYSGNKPYLTEVDQMGILFRDYTRMEADIKFKIQPARGTGYELEKTVSYDYEPAGSGELDPNSPNGSITWENKFDILPGVPGPPAYMTKEVHFTEYVPALLNDIDTIYTPKGYQQIVNGESVQELKDAEQLYIAANLGKHYEPYIFRDSTFGNSYIPFPFALCQFSNRISPHGGFYHFKYDGDLGSYETPKSQEFHAHNIEGIAHCPFALRETRKPCLQTDAWQQVSNVDTRVVHTVQFTDQAISFDPTATYIIHGRRFACKKIELKITDRGLSPLKTGYFYEIKD